MSRNPNKDLLVGVPGPMPASKRGVAHPDPAQRLLVVHSGQGPQLHFGAEKMLMPFDKYRGWLVAEELSLGHGKT